MDFVDILKFVDIQNYLLVYLPKIKFTTGQHFNEDIGSTVMWGHQLTLFLKGRTTGIDINI